MRKNDLKYQQVYDAIQKYHSYMFKLNNKECFDSIKPEKIQEMNNYVKMFNNLIQIIKNVEGIEYIETYLNNTKDFILYSSTSNYYYRKNKINNILWKYLFDC